METIYGANSDPGRKKLRADWGQEMLSFGAESFVFQVATQKFKDQDI